jgi:hypothetical protein
MSLSSRPTAAIFRVGLLRRVRAGGALLVGLWLLFATGCTLWLRSPEAKDPASVFRGVGADSDSVVLEIFSARIPLGDDELNHAVWDSIDEQRLAPELRRQLTLHGMRAGVMSSEMPPAIARAIHLNDEQVTDDPQASDVALDANPVVTLRKWKLASGRRMEYQASPVYPELSFVRPGEDGLAGEFLESALAVLEISPTIRADGRVDLEILPELQYGQPRSQLSVQQGIAKIVTGKPKMAFPELRLTTPLSPGQILVLTCLPQRSGSLGDSFFTETSDSGKQQKIVLIRLARAPHDGQFVDEKPPTAETAGF